MGRDDDQSTIFATLAELRSGLERAPSFPTVLPGKGTLIAYIGVGSLFLLLSVWQIVDQSLGVRGSLALVASAVAGVLTILAAVFAMDQRRKTGIFIYAGSDRLARAGRYAASQLTQGSWAQYVTPSTPGAVQPVVANVRSNARALVDVLPECLNALYESKASLLALGFEVESDVIARECEALEELLKPSSASSETSNGV